MILRLDSRVRRRRLPRQIPPVLLEQDYARGLLRLLEPAFAAYAPLLSRLPDLLGTTARMDAGEGRRIRDVVAAAREATNRTITREGIQDLARKFAARTSTYQRLQLGKQVKAAIGVDPVFKDHDLAVASDQFVHENAALIVRIPERLHGDVEALVQRAVSSSMPSERLAKHIKERFGVSQRHAKLIARDQISKHAGKLNKARQKELGVDKFVWRSVGDERVRDWHRDELDGNTYRWDKPPPNEDGDPVIPGDDVNCRCSAEPVFE